MTVPDPPLTPAVLALAPALNRLFVAHLRHDPSCPSWFDADHLIAPPGPIADLVTMALRLSGYGEGSAAMPDARRSDPAAIHVGADDVLSDAVTCALAGRMMAARFNRPGCTVVDHGTWVFATTNELDSITADRALALGSEFELDRLTLVCADATHRPSRSLDEPHRRLVEAGWQVLHLTAGITDDDLDAALVVASGDKRRPTAILVDARRPTAAMARPTSASTGRSVLLDGRSIRADNPARRFERQRWEREVIRLRRTCLVGDEFAAMVRGAVPRTWSPLERQLLTRALGVTAREEVRPPTFR